MPDFVYDVSDWPDIQELMLFIDAGITDYSSWICEYMLTRKPGFLFAPDMRHYETTNRTFAIQLDELPFPKAFDSDSLCRNIINFDSDKYVKDCNAFLKHHGSVDDGHASERVVKKIKELMG